MNYGHISFNTFNLHANVYCSNKIENIHKFYVNFSLPLSVTLLLNRVVCLVLLIVFRLSVRDAYFIFHYSKFFIFYYIVFFFVSILANAFRLNLWIYIVTESACSNKNSLLRLNQELSIYYVRGCNHIHTIYSNPRAYAMQCMTFDHINWNDQYVMLLFWQYENDFECNLFRMK